MNISQKIAELHQSLVSLDERICHMESRRDFPPAGGTRSDPVVREELRDLYVGQMKLLQLIQHLNKDRPEPDFSETFQSVLETARMADAHAARGSGRPSFALAFRAC
jgi:hypothetical protein